MNKLEKLFATKQQIEAELEQDRRARRDAENIASMEKARAESRAQEKQMDGIFYGQSKEYADVITTNFNVDAETALVFGAILQALKVPLRDLNFQLVSMKRHMENKE